MKGSVALITVLVLMGVLLTFGVAIAAADINLASKSNSFSVVSRQSQFENVCLEESLQRLKGNSALEGVVSYEETDVASCSSDISNKAGEGGLVKTVIVSTSIDRGDATYQSSATYEVDVSNGIIGVVKL